MSVPPRGNRKKSKAHTVSNWIKGPGEVNWQLPDRWLFPTRCNRRTCFLLWQSDSSSKEEVEDCLRRLVLQENGNGKKRGCEVSIHIGTATMAWWSCDEDQSVRSTLLRCGLFFVPVKDEAAVMKASYLGIAPKLRPLSIPLARKYL